MLAIRLVGTEDFHVCQTYRHLHSSTDEQFYGSLVPAILPILVPGNLPPTCSTRGMFSSSLFGYKWFVCPCIPVVFDL